jgi:hypothetical protein
MPAKRKPKIHKRADYFRPHLERQKQARRGMCSWLMFWKACGHKKCLRAHACAAKVDDCFDRFWPIVPEWLKVCIRAAGKAKEAGLSPPQVKAEIARELARWQEMMARQEAWQAAAEPAPQSLPIMPAASAPAQRPRATGRRIHVL